MLVFHAALTHRQEQEVSLFPIDPFAMHDGIAAAVDDVDDQPALVAMLAGLRPHLVGEYRPMPERRVFDTGIEVEAQPALPRHVLRAISVFDDDAARHLPFGKLPVQPHLQLVRIGLRLLPFPSPRTLDFCQDKRSR